MRKIGLLALFGLMPVWAGEMPEKAADYHAALMKRPESAALFDRFRDAWLEERSVEDLEKELLSRAEAKEAGAWAMLGRAWLAAGKTEQALDAFEKARQQSPSAWLDLESAKLRMAAKDFAAAEKDALRVPDGDPQRLEALKLAGLACLRSERIEDALAHWTKAVAAAPGDIGLLEDLTELTRREGRIELALDYCGKWRDATADAYGKAMATLRRSELLLGSQRFDEAMTELVAVLEVSADDSWLEREALARAEQAHRQRGNSTGWVKWIGAQAEAHPSRLNFLRTSAQALAAVGNTDEALAVLTEVMKRSPGDTAVRWQRIGLLEQGMKLQQAYDECAELAAKEKSETSGLKLAELAFRLEKKTELKRALDDVLAAADPGKRVGLAGLYARYGLSEGSEKIWREEAGGEQGGQALRFLAKHLKTAGRDQDSINAWKQLGGRDVAQDRMDAAQMLSAAGDRAAAREILMAGREKFSTEPGYESALADLAVADGKVDEARAIYLKLAKAAKHPEELVAAAKGWVQTSTALEDPIKDLGDETADRCLRAAWLASKEKPLPAVRDGDELEAQVRQGLLRGLGRWAEVVDMMQAVPGERGPLFLSELAEAKAAAGDLSGALTVTQSWRARVPDQTGPWLFEAGILEKLGKPSDATTLLRRAAARFEDNEDIARRLFSLLLQSLDPREALEWAWKRHDRSQDESVRSNWLREILHVSKEREQLDELQARFEERVRRDPASPGPLLALAELARARGDARAEMDFLRRAAVNSPRDVALISSLAAVEERSGEATRALERFATLARLAPGPDSARALAQAKIRLGDIEGGMRDLQALAGEKGMDPRALEQSAGDLAARGYVEEAIRMLAAVEPAQRTARLEFVLGQLLDADGREMEAIDAFFRVLAEPEDPAEKPQMMGYVRALNSRASSQLLQAMIPRGRSSGRSGLAPGVFSGLEVPQSLVEAQFFVKIRLAKLAMQRGGEAWSKVVTAVPELTKAKPGQWREAADFMQPRQQSGSINWWEFVRNHPDNPLGVDLLTESGQIQQGTPGDIEALLKTHPPLLVRIQLRWGRGEWRADDPEFFESIRPDEWQDEQARSLALSRAFLMSSMALEEGGKQKVSIADCSRVMAVLEKVGFTGAHAGLMEMLKARQALMTGNPDDFLKHLAAWDEAVKVRSNLNMQQYGYVYIYGHGGPPIDVFQSWKKKAGDAAAEALIGKIPSPLIRCQLSNDEKPILHIARVKRELAALPKDAPVETRRALTRLHWQCLSALTTYEGNERRRAVNEDLFKELEATAADETNPRMAMEATMELMKYRQRERGFTPEDRAKANRLVTQLAASPDPSDQDYAAQLEGYVAATQQQQRRTPVATRWGGAGRFSTSSYGSGRSMLPTILAMEDKDQAQREAARLLEGTARAFAGQPEYLGEMIESLSKAELLDGALARISLPSGAGLGRRVAMLNLFEACSKQDRARSLLEELAKARPWETYWTVELALQTADNAEMRRLLDLVAERDDFDQLLLDRYSRRNREDPKVLLTEFKRLADWLPQAKGRRTWVGTVLLMLSKGGGGLPGLEVKSTEQLECYRRYLQLMLEDRRVAELGFRVMTTTFRIDAPEAFADAARRVLLSGAYTSEGPLAIESAGQGEMELASLEHLVLVATEKGDEVAFPTDFREQLKAADPESSAWLSKLLAAKTVSELPDVSNDKAKSSGWVAMARHEAAVLRAVSMPGREAWLVEVFRKNLQQSLSGNLRHVIRESLSAAQKNKKLPQQVFALLEASAGPRKDWWKKEPNNQPKPKVAQLQQSAGIILDAAVETDPEAVLALLDVLREARVPISNPQSAFSKLGKFLKTRSPQVGTAPLAELLSKRSDSPYTLGVWQWQGYQGTKPVFLWGLAEVIEGFRPNLTSEMLKKVKDDPNAGFLDLFEVMNNSGDNSLRRRAIQKAGPDLAKLPVEIRNPVIDHLTNGMTDEDATGLPAVVSARLIENAAAVRKQRITQVRLNLESMRSGAMGSSNQSQQYGNLLGQVIGDDDALATEILAAWRPLADADKSGKQTEAFVGGLVSNRRSGLRPTLTILRLLEGLLKDAPLVQLNANSSDPIGALWNQTGPDAKVSPELWRQIAALSPRLQARFWLSALRYTGGLPELTADAKLEASLRDAVKGGEVTRSALEWLMASNLLRRDSQTRIDAVKLLDFAKALRSAGAPVGSLSELISRNYYLSRMENAGTLMAEIPTLLAGTRTLTAEQGAQLLAGVPGLWQKVIYERRRNVPVAAALPASVYPVETAALLKFLFSSGINFSPNSIDENAITSIAVALDDAELLGLWTKVGGKSLVGDLSLIATFLEKDRLPEALALAPMSGQQRDGSRLNFTNHLESLISKLRDDPSTAAFKLRVCFSIQLDARGDDAPRENREERRTRLIEEFGRVRGNLSIAERAELCVLLRLGQESGRNVPALDEFASDQAAREFKRMLTGEGSSDLAGLFVPAVCSRVYVGDLSGIDRLASVVNEVPVGRRNENLISQNIVPPVLNCLLGHIAALDAKLPPATLESILSCAKVLATSRQPENRNMVSQLVHFALTDAASLEAALKRCGLEGVKPGITGYSSFVGNRDPATVRALLRLALLHPVASEALVDSLSPQRDPGITISAFLPALRDPALRARISPAVFLNWSRYIVPAEAAELESLKLYATERRADCDEAQRTALDQMVERWNRTSSPESMERIRRQREEMKVHDDQFRIRRMQGD